MKRALLGIACAVGLSAAIAPVAAVAGQEGFLEGFGTDVPLGFAISQIVPPSYQVSYGPGVDREAKVSWSGGDQWPAVLGRMAQARGISVTYQDRTVRLTVAGGQAKVAAAPGAPRSGFVMMPYQERPAEAPAPVTAPAPQVAAPVAAPVVEVVQPPPAPEPAPVPAQRWTATKGRTVDQVISEWAEKAGWEVVFRTKMIYDVEAPAEFSGSFVEAMEAFIRSISVKPQLTATFYQGNRTVLIANLADQAL